MCAFRIVPQAMIAQVNRRYDFMGSTNRIRHSLVVLFRYRSRACAM
jgi:hypothetical protein